MKGHLEENDIRPDGLKDGQLRAQLEDVAFLKSRKKSFVRVCCPACGSEQSGRVFKKFSFPFESCKDCGTVFMNPRATAEILDEFYRNSRLYDFWYKYTFPASLEVRRKNIFVPRVRRVIDICKKYGVKPGTLVEVGAGYGIFMEEMRRKKFFKKMIAIEPSPGLAAQCREAGVEVIEKTVENVPHGAIQADVLVSFEVIEHLFSPLDFLKNCYRMLEKGGVVITTCPNFYGFDIATLREISDSIDAEHINLFNPDSMNVLLERAGFRVIEISTPGELDAELVRKKILNNEFSLKDQPFLKRILVDKWEDFGRGFQEFLKNNKLSSHMWVVAVKS